MSQFLGLLEKELWNSQHGFRDKARGDTQMVRHLHSHGHTHMGTLTHQAWVWVSGSQKGQEQRLALILLLRGMRPILDPKCLQGRAGAQLGDPLPGDPRDETQTPKALPGDTQVERRHTLGEADTPSIVLSVSCVLCLSVSVSQCLMCLGWKGLAPKSP